MYSVSNLVFVGPTKICAMCIFFIISLFMFLHWLCIHPYQAKSKYLSVELYLTLCLWTAPLTNAGTTDTGGWRHRSWAPQLGWVRAEQGEKLLYCQDFNISSERSDEPTKVNSIYSKPLTFSFIFTPQEVDTS